MLDTIIRFAEGLPPSILSHHGRDCCAEARGWFLAMDRAWVPQNRVVPAWIRLYHEWGPSRWPMYWCEAMKAKKLDCGALSALALEAFTVRMIRALPCQIIRVFDRRSVAQWQRVWGSAGINPAWAEGTQAYHEVCAIPCQGAMEIWDPSDGVFVQPDSGSYGTTVALKVRGGDGGTLRWGHLDVPLNRWHRIDHGRVTGPVPGQHVTVPVGTTASCHLALLSSGGALTSCLSAAEQKRG